MRGATKLRPGLTGTPWLIGANPRDLGELQGDIDGIGGGNRQEVVDHHIWCDAAGAWRLWACVRGTAVGRILYGWTAPNLEINPWTPIGVMMRRDKRAGESVADKRGEEWIQSPFVVHADGCFTMFYGGSWVDPCGTLPISSICMATSTDGVHFTRVLDDKGRSTLFSGPGEARDPCLLQHDGLWFLYYSGNENHEQGPNKVYVRTSCDLRQWSGSREVCWGGSVGSHSWSAECPHVVWRDGYFYLFRTENYAKGNTVVYRSLDPFDFGLDSDEKLLGRIDVAAPEIVVHNGGEYITSNKDLRGGCRLQRLEWREE